MADRALDPELLDLIAERFRALGEPVRLRILNELRGGEHTVTELVEATGLGQANVSKHLQYLHTLHFVERRKEGLYVYYQLAGDHVFELCDLMCGRLEAELEAQRRLVSGG